MDIPAGAKSDEDPLILEVQSRRNKITEMIEEVEERQDHLRSAQNALYDQILVLRSFERGLGTTLQMLREKKDREELDRTQALLDKSVKPAPISDEHLEELRRKLSGQGPRFVDGV